MRKRIKDLSAGDIFWFSGLWRTVVKKDETFLYYGIKREHGYRRNPVAYADHTIMVNSMMMVDVKEPELIEKQNIAI